MLIRPVIFCGILSMLMLCMAGCFSSLTSSSSLSNDKLQANLIVGKTTQDEVKKLYGQPTSVKNGKSGATWIYIFEPSELDRRAKAVGATAANTAIAHGTAGAMAAGASAGAGSLGILGASIAGTQASSMMSSAMMGNSETKTLTISFDKAGVVKSYSMN